MGVFPTVHIAYTAYAINDSATVLTICGISQQLRIIESIGQATQSLIVIHLDRVIRLQPNYSVTFH